MIRLVAISFAEIAAFATPALGVALGWLLKKKVNAAELRKMDVETDGLELKNLHLATKIWKDMVRDMQKEVAQLREQVQKLQSQVFAFSMENSQLKEELESLRDILNQKTMGNK